MVNTHYIINQNNHYFAVTGNDFDADNLTGCMTFQTKDEMYAAVCARTGLCLDEVNWFEIILIQDADNNLWTEIDHRGCTSLDDGFDTVQLYSYLTNICL
ncbi:MULTISPECIES: hypothetical protein [Photobacterium]|jgi:hypothetical protein|uniref:Uncharacterized protein n=1 Tax=Photobacterium carnosum TaxID=2023717 RepID=A0A2N4UQ04_9GAMM|nr:MULTISPECIES: hypothetical protein [Photobacterium]MBY3789363.1 hypothetical protein [Photobacterium carnosum]MCD9463258.1 hypothetical protein [Photobacterium phosphoreum]MCD9480750.1 hypothetical protein [Photobacterium phosphoreum]MCD9512338.1 hypothetical protein [Photobacterium phosphoreum]MCD9534422.1 hypothetical protein [Photobacterium carnosum]